MPHRLVLAAVLALLGATPAFAQGGGVPSPLAAPGGLAGQRTPPRAPGEAGTSTGTGIIRGFVVSLESGTPIRRAQVRIIGADITGARMATTDGLGRFEFRDLPPGRYRLTASKGGLVSLEYGQRRPAQNGTPLELSDKQVMEKVVIGLPRGSVITGRVTDEFGEPVTGANVMVLQSRSIGGSRRWTSAGGSDRTDDLGQFRIYGLPPGEYIVSATLQMMGFGADTASDVSGFAPTYYPGVPSPVEAQRITLGLGEEHGGASFSLIPTRLVGVEGTVSRAQGGPVTQGMVMLLPDDPTGQAPTMLAGGYNGRIDQNGRFKIANVAPGRYIAQARPAGPNNGEVARTPVVVGEEKIDNLALVLVPGGRIIGRLVMDTGEPLPAELQRVNVSATPAQAGSAPGLSSGPARVNPDGTFELRGLIAPVRIRLFGPPTAMMTSVLIAGQDYVDAPIEVQPGQTLTGVEVVVTTRVNSVSGVIADGQGRPLLDASVLIFADDPRLWQPGSRHLRSARPDQQGRYRVDALPPADYLAIAVQDYEEGQVNDPAYLATLRAGATRFSLRDGEAKVVDLRQK